MSGKLHNHLRRYTAVRELGNEAAPPAVAGCSFYASLSGIGKRDWFPITRQIYAKVNAAGQSDRADTFNRNYGLMRGVTASFFTLAVVVVAADYQDWKAALIVAVLGVVALARMHRFGKHYAREVFVQYLEL